MASRRNSDKRLYPNQQHPDNGLIKAGEEFYIIPLENIRATPKPRCAFIGGGRWADDEEVLNYVNHSCSPNSKLEITGNPRLIAVKDIEEAEAKIKKIIKKLIDQ